MNKKLILATCATLLLSQLSFASPAFAKQNKEVVDIVIANGQILTMDKDKTILKNGVVVVNDNKIIDIGDNALLKKYSASKFINAENDIIMPGFINTHTHASMTAFRSLADDVPDRLSRYIFPLENKMVSRDLVYKGAVHGILEMLQAGTTTFTDMYYFEDEVAKAATEIGMRGIVGETVIKNPVADAQEPYGGIDYAVKFIEKYKNNSLITPAFAPHAPTSLDTEHLKKIDELSKKYNVPVLMHVAETPKESEFYKNTYNMTPVQYLDSIGVLNERLVAAHCIFVDDKDIELMKKNNVGVAHNMVANIKSAKGVSPALKMFDQGLRIGLGTDGPMSGNTLDIVGQMGYVAKVHKLDTQDRAAMPPYKVVEMATIGGAKALHMEDKIGSIEKGKLADIIRVSTKGLNMMPIYDLYSALVYSAYPTDIDTVIVNGKVLMENRKIKTYDLNKNRKAMEGLSKEVERISKTL